MPTENRPLDITSPIAKMPFGKHKGEIIWTIGLGGLSWIIQNIPSTERTQQTFKDAQEMAVHSGEWAVLRKFPKDKFYVKLQDIYNTKHEAEKACVYSHGNFEDFTYQIIESTSN